MMFFKRRANSGFTLVETLLVLFLILTASIFKIREINAEIEINKAKTAGEQIKNIAEAANNYIFIRSHEITQMISASGTSKDLGPRTCSGNVCTITTATLVNERLLPETFTGKDVNGSNYSIQLRRNGVAPNYVINGLVVANKPWAEGTKIRYDLLGRAMQVAGSDSAVSKNNSMISGYSGNWTEYQSNYSIINKAGVLAQRVGYNSELYSVYLRRDGSLPMTGALNMNGNNIKNPNNISVNGAITTTNIDAGTINAGGTISANGEIRAKNGYGALISIGGDSSGGDYEIRASDPAKPISIYSPSAGSYTTVLQVIKGNMKVSKRMGLMGVDPNILPSGWNGGLTTWDAYALGTVAAGSGGDAPAYLNSAGNIYASNNITSNTMTTNYLKSNGGMDVSAGFSSNTVNSNYIKSNGNLDLGGSSSASSLNASGRINTNEYAQINGIASNGGGCSPNGLFGREPSGEILFCKNGRWTKPSGGGWNGERIYKCPSNFPYPCFGCGGYSVYPTCRCTAGATPFSCTEVQVKK